MAEWQSIITTTLDLKEDYDILDIVNVTVAGNTWKDEAAGLGLEIDTGWLSQGDVSVVFAVASASLKYSADQVGADAVVGFRFITSPVMQGSAELLAYGTAVKLR